MSSKLSFNAQTARKRPIKPMPAKFAESKIRPNIEVSDGIRPHFPMVPLRYLDVKYQDITTEQWVVIPKGRIISAITVQNEVTGDLLKVGGSAVVEDELVHTVTAGEDAATEFAALALDNKNIDLASVVITDGTETFTDANGDGTLVGSAGGTGTLVAATGALSLTFNAAPGEDAQITATYKYAPATNIYVGVLNQIDQTPLYIGADESFYGVTRDIMGLMVPANGGVDRVVTYDADDVAAAVPDSSGSQAAVSVGGSYTIPANAPVGVAFQDVYQDIRGANLNYEMWKSYGILAEQVIALPFVDYGLLRALAPAVKFVENDEGATKSGYKIGQATIDATKDAGYLAAEKRFSFLYFDSEQNKKAGLSGQLLQSDLFGNWVPAGAAAANSTGITLNAAKTAQTVGRILFVDTRFPKDLLDTVESMYGQRVEGTGTEGLPANLFDFINTVLVAGGYSFGTVDAAKVARELVNQGAFGIVNIQLSAR